MSKFGIVWCPLCSEEITDADFIVYDEEDGSLAHAECADRNMATR